MMVFRHFCEWLILGNLDTVLKVVRRFNPEEDNHLKTLRPNYITTYNLTTLRILFGALTGLSGSKLRFLRQWLWPT